jgi:hypothetical protein
VQKIYESAFSGEVYYHKNDGKIKYLYRIEMTHNEDSLDCVPIIDAIINCVIRSAKLAYDDDDNVIDETCNDFFEKLLSAGCGVIDDSAKYMIKDKLQSIQEKLQKNSQYYHAEIYRCDTQPTPPKRNNGNQAALFAPVERVGLSAPPQGGGNGLPEGGEDVAGQGPDQPYPSPGPQPPKPPVVVRPPVIPPVTIVEETVRIRGRVKSSRIKIENLLVEEVDKNVCYKINLSDNAAKKLKEIINRQLRESAFVFEVSLKRNSDNSYDVKDIE